MIVKIQRPLMCFGVGEPKVLVYDKSRQNECQIPMTDELSELMGDLPKIYAKVKIQGKLIEITDVVPDQDW